MEELLRQRRELLTAYNRLSEYFTRRWYEERCINIFDNANYWMLISYEQLEAIRRFSRLNDDENRSFFERIITTHKAREAADELLKCLVLTLAEEEPGCIEFTEDWIKLKIPVDLMFLRKD